MNCLRIYLVVKKREVQAQSKYRAEFPFMKKLKGEGNFPSYFLTLKQQDLCPCVCVCVCVRLNNSGTAGPIWLNFFFVSSVLVTGWFQAKKNPDQGSGFSGNPEKNRFLGYYLTNLPEMFREYTLDPKILNTNKFLDLRSGFSDPKSGFFQKNPVLTV